MQPNRSRRREFETPDDSSATWNIDPLRASTADSGRASVVHSGRSSTRHSNMIMSPDSAVLLRDTPTESLSTDRSGTLEEVSMANEIVFQCVSRVSLRSVAAATIKPMFRTSTIHQPSSFNWPILVETTNHCTQGSSTRCSSLILVIGSFATSTFYSENTSNESSWRVGEYCVAKYSGNQLYRARILVVPSSESTIFHHCTIYPHIPVV